MTEEQVIKKLSQAGYRITQPRRAVIRVLLEDGAFDSPAQIWQRAREHHPQVGQVTVYRTLELLSRLGFVRRIHTDSGCHGHATVGAGHSHHLVCRQCGTTVEFEGCDLAPLLKRVGKHSGFAIEEHLLELVGLCPNCLGGPAHEVHSL